MKIAIITFSVFKDNYGQILQAYALQQYLNRKGHDVYHLKYTRKTESKDRKLCVEKNLCKLLRSLVVQKIFVPYRLYLNRKFRKLYPCSFQKFEQENIKYYPQIYHCLEDLQANPPVADCYICGSDQIWNTGTSTNSKAFYLDFGIKETLRIAYAPSFGRPSVNKDEEDFYKQQLANFDRISVREQEGVEICNRLGYYARRVIDPTFLLNSDYYRSLYDGRNTNCTSNSFIFCYFLNFRNSKEVYWNRIKKYCKEQKYECIVSLASGAYPAMPLLNGANYVSYEPQDWIRAIDECKYFITNSFHGLAFALIMRKPFLVLTLGGSTAKMNGRIYSLLKTVGLESRIYDYTNLIKSQIDKPIDWDKVATIIREEQKNAEKFLSL